VKDECLGGWEDMDRVGGLGGGETKYRSNCRTSAWVGGRMNVGLAAGWVGG